MADAPQLPLLPASVFLKSSNPALDAESLLHWAHTMNAAITDVNAWLEQGIRHTKQQRAALVPALQSHEDSMKLLGVPTPSAPPSTATPWCCVSDCDSTATWTLYTGNGPDDNTQSCDAHVAELLGDNPLINIEPA